MQQRDTLERKVRGGWMIAWAIFLALWVVAWFLQMTGNRMPGNLGNWFWNFAFLMVLGYLLTEALLRARRYHKD